MAGFSMARTTVREGLRILESQGLIEVRRGRRGGGRVTHPRMDHLAQGLALSLQLQQVTYRDVDEARRMIEPVLAGRLARRATGDDIAALNGIIRAAEVAARVPDREGFAELATQFHQTIVERAGNLTMATVAQLIRELVTSYYVSAAERDGADAATFARAVRSYRKLVRLVEAGDAEGAEEHWRRQMVWTSSASENGDEPIAFL
jgi:DNA-binding FadR family transcriptional regulator